MKATSPSSNLIPLPVLRRLRKENAFIKALNRRDAERHREKTRRLVKEMVQQKGKSSPESRIEAATARAAAVHAKVEDIVAQADLDANEAPMNLAQVRIDELVIQKVLATGELAGGQLIGGAFSSLFQTAATTAAAAAVAAPIGVPAVTAGAAGLAAVMSTLSTAAGHGSAGAIIIAGSGLPPRSARGRPGDDITGDKSVRELIAKGKGNYY